MRNKVTKIIISIFTLCMLFSMVGAYSITSKYKELNLNNLEKGLVNKLDKDYKSEIVNIDGKDAIVYKDARITIYPTDSEKGIEVSVSNNMYNSANIKMLDVVNKELGLDNIIYVEAKNILNKGYNNHKLVYGDILLQSYMSYAYDTTAVKISIK